MDFNKICRVCLTESNNMQSVFMKIEKSDIFEVNICLAEVITKLTGYTIEPNDNLPHLICNICIDLVNYAYKFKVKFESSYNILKQCLLESSYKDEPAEFNIEDFVEDTVIVESIPSKGRRNTSKSQIEKRTILKPMEMKSLRKRNRKSKLYDSVEMTEESEVKSKGPIIHTCPICMKKFTALELRTHIQSHKALKKYLNIPIDKKIKSTTSFYANIIFNELPPSLHKRKVKLHECVSCHLAFEAKDLRLHLDKHRNLKEYKCDQCERVFKKVNHLNTHRVKHLKEYPYKCENCGKGFVIKKNYDCHMLTHNANQELPHECSYCLRRFSNPEHLNRHLVIHTENVSYSVKYRVCKCKNCLKTFKDKAELKQHTCVPVEKIVKKRYPCKMCNKLFKNSSGLCNHKRIVHKLQGAKVLCSVCGNYVSNIYNHMMRHSGEKPFECNQCGKRFIAKPQLKQHLLVHSGLKPFVCSVCAKAFNNLYNLQVHERIHVGNRCHVCPICDKGFLEKSYLRKHMNIHVKM